VLVSEVIVGRFKQRIEGLAVGLVVVRLAFLFLDGLALVMRLAWLIARTSCDRLPNRAEIDLIRRQGS